MLSEVAPRCAPEFGVKLHLSADLLATPSPCPRIDSNVPTKVQVPARVDHLEL